MDTEMTAPSRANQPTAPLLAPDQGHMVEENVAYKALSDANLICYDHLKSSFQDLTMEKGNWSAESQFALSGLTALTCHCFGLVKYPIIEPGCVREGSYQDGTNRFYGPGVYVLGPFQSLQSGSNRISDGAAIVNGTKAIVTVKQGFVGYALERGEPILLPPGLHQWDNADIKFVSFIDLSSSLIKLGPYTLVTVEECYAAVTQDNGKQKVLEGGKSYMLTHQNWKFQTWLSQKMNTDKIGPMEITTGDNITLDITANCNWYIHDAHAAAARHVDTSEEANPLLKKDSIKMMRDDVKLQVSSSLAALVGSIQYGSKGAAGLAAATRDGKEKADRNDDEVLHSQAHVEEKSGRQALWDVEQLRDAVSHANDICNRYGVTIISLNLISAAPSDPNLVNIMMRGAIASITAGSKSKEATMQANAAIITAEAKSRQALAQADAMLVKVRSQAEAITLTAEADADATRILAQGSKEAGQLMGESQVAVDLAKLNIAYGPFAENQSSTFFFGLEGPGELPNSILGEALAKETGTSGLAKGSRR